MCIGSEAIIERLRRPMPLSPCARRSEAGAACASVRHRFDAAYTPSAGALWRVTRTRVQLLIHERHVDLINEKIDGRFRITSHFDQDQSLIKRDLGVRQRILVAGAQLVEKAGSLPQSFEQLASLPTLSMGSG
ncbi:hypothetical protein M8494_15795 [Serratia ureilytica]